jgi:hydrogenase expression/formation protein HypE
MVANEGRFALFIAAEEAEKAVQIIRRHADGAQAVVIGRVSKGKPGLVRVLNTMGTSRLLDLPSGEPLPRIC